MDALMNSPIAKLVLGNSVGASFIVAGTTTTLTTLGSISYIINGKPSCKPAAANGTAPTTDVNTGVAFLPVKTNKGSIFTIGLNAAGTLKAAQGSIEDLDGTGAFIRAPQFGPMPDDFCPIGYLVIKAGATAAAGGWVFGTNNMSSVTGITYTFVSVCTLPDRPQIA